MYVHADETLLSHALPQKIDNSETSDYTIDLLFITSAPVRNLYSESSIRKTLTAQVQYLNDIQRASGTRLHFRVASIYASAYASSGNLSNDLIALYQHGDGDLDEVESILESTGADHAHLVLLAHNLTQPYLGTRGYSVSEFGNYDAFVKEVSYSIGGSPIHALTFSSNILSGSTLLDSNNRDAWPVYSNPTLYLLGSALGDDLHDNSENIWREGQGVANSRTLNPELIPDISWPSSQSSEVFTLLNQAVEIHVNPAIWDAIAGNVVLLEDEVPINFLNRGSNTVLYSPASGGIHRLSLSSLNLEQLPYQSSFINILSHAEPNHPWMNQTLGPTTKLNQITWAGNQLTMRAYGNYKGESDWYFHNRYAYTYTTVIGDFSIEAAMNGWNTTGIMVMEQLEGLSQKMLLQQAYAISPYQAELIPEYDHGILGTMARSAALSPGSDLHLKLQRTGDIFRAFISGNGIDWSEFSSKKLVMTGPIHVGFAKADAYPDSLSDIVINSAGNTPPNLSISSNTYTISTGDTLTLSAQASDDGLPFPSRLSYQWRQATGDSLLLENMEQSSLTAVFPTAGYFTFTIQVSDGWEERQLQVTVTVTDPESTSPPPLDSESTTEPEILIPDVVIPTGEDGNNTFTISQSPNIDEAPLLTSKGGGCYLYE